MNTLTSVAKRINVPARDGNIGNTSRVKSVTTVADVVDLQTFGNSRNRLVELLVANVADVADKYKRMWSLRILRINCQTTCPQKSQIRVGLYI